MAPDLCRLTLVFPTEAEPAVLAVIEQHEPALPGFTTWKANGHGGGFHRASHAEKVAGKVSRVVLTMILGRERVDLLLEDIRSKAPAPHLVFWLEPVLAAGRLA